MGGTEWAKGRWQILFNWKQQNCQLHAGSFWLGCLIWEWAPQNVYINSTKGSTETKLMFDRLVQMGLKPLFLVHCINVLKWIWSKYWWGYKGFQYRNDFNIQISESTHLTSLITNCTLFLKVIPTHPDWTIFFIPPLNEALGWLEYYYGQRKVNTDEMMCYSFYH